MTGGLASGRMKYVLDACVLFPTVMREVLLAFAARGLFAPVWSDRILGEWHRAGLKQGQGARVADDIARARDGLLKTEVVLA